MTRFEDQGQHEPKDSRDREKAFESWRWDRIQSERDGDDDE